MNKYKIFFCIITFLLLSCEDNSDKWNIDVSNIESEIKITDISKDLYNLDISFEDFKNKYPFYLNPETPDKVYISQRTDSLDLLVYEEIKNTIEYPKLEKELATLFKHIKFYFPEFKEPEVYVYSSVLNEEAKYNPILYSPSENYIFIAIDYFMGDQNTFYKSFKVEDYLQQSMNPQNIVPKVSFAIAETIAPIDIKSKQFLNMMVLYGKLMIFQDAFLPGYSEELKISYTPEQIDWCLENEPNMWNYLIQNDYLFSDDQDLIRRFIAPAPFSKFYTLNEAGESVDLNSPGRAGVWIGWQIMKAYIRKNPDLKLEEIMTNTDFQKIFNESKYQPKL